MLFALQKLRSAQKLICLVGLMTALPILCGSYAIWVTSDVRTNEITDEGLMKLERKIGETYTSEMHQNISDIVRLGDDAIISMLGNIRDIGRVALILGLVAFGACVLSLLHIKKAIAAEELAEQGSGGNGEQRR